MQNDSPSSASRTRDVDVELALAILFEHNVNVVLKYVTLVFSEAVSLRRNIRFDVRDFLFLLSWLLASGVDDKVIMIVERRGRIDLIFDLGHDVVGVNNGGGIISGNVEFFFDGGGKL